MGLSTTTMVAVAVLVAAAAVVFVAVRSRSKKDEGRTPLSAQVLDIDAFPMEILANNEPAPAPSRPAPPKATTKLTHLDRSGRKDRIPIASPVRINRSYDGITREIGPGGMSLGTEAELRVSQPIQLSFALPTGQPVNIAGVVWWRKERTVGVRFDVYDKQAVVIRKWIEKQAAEPTQSGAAQA